MTISNLTVISQNLAGLSLYQSNWRLQVFPENQTKTSKMLISSEGLDVCETPGESLGNLLEYSSKENPLEDSLGEVLGGESQTGPSGGKAQGNLLGKVFIFMNI